MSLYIDMDFPYRAATIEICSEGSVLLNQQRYIKWNMLARGPIWEHANEIVENLLERQDISDYVRLDAPKTYKRHWVTHMFELDVGICEVRINRLQSPLVSTECS
jgi:hypothetical protein